MSHSTNFLNWSLGHEARWAVELEADQVPGHRQENRMVRSWVQVKDGPRMWFQYHGRTYHLKFGSKSEEREAREWLKEVPEPFLMRAEFSAAEGGGVGNLVFMRGNDPAVMTEPPVILITDEALSACGTTDRRHFFQKVMDQIMVKSPQDFLMLVQVPMRVFNLFDDADTSAVRVFLSDGSALVCDIAGPPGGEHLVVRNVDDSRKGSGRLPFVKFIKLPGVPRVADSADSIRGASLEAFRGQRHEFLEAWLAYESADSHFNKLLFESRMRHPLEYELIGTLDEQNCYPLRVINASDALKWVSEDRLGKNGRFDTDAFVEIRPSRKAGNGQSDPKPLHGRIKAFVFDAGNDKAFFEPDKGIMQKPPPHHGRIVAVEDYSNEEQLKRRREAMERLLKGATPMPRLLEYLGQPEAIPAAPGKGTNCWQRPGGPFMTGPMRRALVQASKEPRVFMVQGPPGTGKTTLIAEIIHQVLHRRRNRRDTPPASGETPRGPVRFLVASTQNDTIRNACDRLLAQGLQVDLYAGDRAAASDGDQLLCDTTADKVIAAIENAPVFKRLNHLLELARRLERLSETVPSDHVFEALSALLQVDAAEAFTPSLKASLENLLEQFQKARDGSAQGTAAAADRACCDPAEIGDELASVLEEFVKASSPMSAEAAPAVGPLLERLLALVEAHGANASEAVHFVGPTINYLRLRLESIRRGGELSEKTLDAWRVAVEAASACTTRRQGDSPAVAARPVDEAAARLTRAAGCWIERAARAVREELEKLEKTDEFTLLAWAGILRNEPATFLELKARHTPFKASTCQKAKKALNPLRLSGIQEGHGAQFYDIVIIDEAARAGIDILIPMVLGRSVILVGDHRQLPPYLEKQIYDRVDQKFRENVDLTQESMFSRLWQQIPSTNKVSLTMQYRMHEDIGRVVSKVFYEPEIRLEHYFAGERASERAPAFGLFENRPLVWVDTSGELPAAASPDWEWPCDYRNDYEARLVFELLEEVDIEALKEVNGGRSDPAVGVITFYKKQKNLIASFLDRLSPDRRRMAVVGSVDSFQGKEFPLVILSAVRSNSNGDIGFLKMPHRINVALSRAQRQLIILGDTWTLAARRDKAYSSKLGEIVEIMRDPTWPGIVVDSREVLR